MGQLWSNGETFFAIDRLLMPSWHGCSGGDYERLIVPLSWDAPSVLSINGLAAGLLPYDSLIYDEGWLEVFRRGDEIAVIQCGDERYGDGLRDMLASTNVEEFGDPFEIPSGELALATTALDGAGSFSSPLLLAAESATPEYFPNPNDMPDVVHGGGLLLHVPPGRYVAASCRIDDDDLSPLSIRTRITRTLGVTGRVPAQMTMNKRVAKGM